MPRIRIEVHTGFDGCKHEDEIEFDDDEWERLSAMGREEVLDELATEMRANYCECNAWVINESDESEG